MELVLESDPGRPAPRQGLIAAYKSEIDEYYSELVLLASMEPGLAFQRLAAISARLAEMRGHLWRQGGARDANTLRSREVDPLIETCEFIFKSLSRAEAVRQFEYTLTAKL